MCHQFGAVYDLHSGFINSSHNTFHALIYVIVAIK